SPAIRRILREAKELAEADPDIYAAPAEDDLFEWHFVIRGPPSSVYEHGLYHGRINLPSNYPMSPPSFRFLHDSGRFEVNREICLSISNFHVEEWQPAWGIRMALVALRSFMLTSADGAVGSIDGVPDETRRKIAERSRSFVCPKCRVRNDCLLADKSSSTSTTPAAAPGAEGTNINDSHSAQKTMVASSTTPNQTTTTPTHTTTTSQP
ncbi:ubiquitin-conjugating enzyme/RWD-like protein, partial [Myxozyma melibiosi]